MEERTENVSGHTFESRVGQPCGVPHAFQGVVQKLCDWQGLERRHQEINIHMYELIMGI